MTESSQKELTTTNKETTSSEICPICKNTGWEVYVKNGIDYVRECKCGILKQEIHNRRIRFAEIPEMYKEARLDNFKKSVYKKQESREMVVEAATAIRYWLQNLQSMKERGIGLYIYSGTKGSGKTRLISSIANELIQKHETQVKFTTSIQILQEIRQSWKDKRDGESKLIEYLTTADVLIIDDFGAEGVKDWIDERFYSIINGRYTDKKIILFTSNMRIDDLQYDSRIIDRIKERSLQIPFPEESVRDILALNLKKELVEGMKRGGA